MMVIQYNLGSIKQKWLDAGTSLKKKHDLEWGALFKAYKIEFDLTNTQIGLDFGISEPTVTIKVNHFEDYTEAEKKGLADRMATKASVNSALRGTIEDKVVTLGKVAKDVGKPIDKVSADDIRKSYDSKKSRIIRKSYDEEVIDVEPINSLADAYSAIAKANEIEAEGERLKKQSDDWVNSNLTQDDLTRKQEQLADMIGDMLEAKEAEITKLITEYLEEKKELYELYDVNNARFQYTANISYEFDQEVIGMPYYGKVEA